MSYASVADMVDWFGNAEMIRASTPDGAEAVTLVSAPIQNALDNATSMIDTYLRKRYQVPLDVAPQEINRACLLLARYDLSLGGERNPSEQTKVNRDEVVSWLKLIAEGKVVLDLSQVAPGDESFAQASSRPQVFGDQGAGCAFPVPGDGFGFYGGPL